MELQPVVYYEQVLNRGLDALNKGVRKYGYGSAAFSKLTDMVDRSVWRAEDLLDSCGLREFCGYEKNLKIKTEILRVNVNHSMKIWRMVV